MSPPYLNIARAFSPARQIQIKNHDHFYFYPPSLFPLPHRLRKSTSPFQILASYEKFVSPSIQCWDFRNLVEKPDLLPDFLLAGMSLRSVNAHSLSVKPLASILLYSGGALMQNSIFNPIQLHRHPIYNLWPWQYSKSVVVQNGSRDDRKVSTFFHIS